MIYSNVVKILPSMNHFALFTKNVDEYNQLMLAFRSFYDSAMLTKDDYCHIVNVLKAKLPILEASGDMAQYTDVVLAYVKQGYVPNPDFDKVIPAFLQGVKGLRTRLLCECFIALCEKLPDLSDFVGIEAKNKFSDTPITQSQYDFIVSINKPHYIPSDEE